MHKIEKVNWGGVLYSLNNTKNNREINKLQKLINNFIEVTKIDESKEIVGEYISEITDISLKLFRDEEDKMRKCNYADYKAHVEEHDKFTYKLAIYNYCYLTSELIMVEEIVNYIKSWWMGHISSYDIEFNQV